jgi:hypothetical protein
MFGPGSYYFAASPFKLAPILIVFYWWVVVLNALQLCWHCLDLWTGRWQQPLVAKGIAFQLIGLIPLGILLTAQGRVYLLLKHPLLDQEKYEATLAQVNHGIFTGVLVICGIIVIKLIVDIGKMAFDAYRKSVTAQ